MLRDDDAVFAIGNGLAKSANDRPPLVTPFIISLY